ncbi:MAG: hypothetical protein R3C60_02750 [Parvularculaceae bacterium]
MAFGAAASAASVVLIFAGQAAANETQICAERYSLEDSALLEAAAFGGDPHAQMALAECSYPDGGKARFEKMSSAQRLYALKWNIIATCDADQSPAHNRRDRRLRNLKSNADISFRRFGGMQKNEKTNWRERDFMEYRKEQMALLRDRLDRLNAQANEDEKAAARGEIADSLSRMGPVGALRLAEISSCQSFGADNVFEAAAWSAASEAWSDAMETGVYGAAAGPDHDMKKIASEKFDALSAKERSAAVAEQSRLMRTDPENLAAIEGKAKLYESNLALARLADFSVPKRMAAGGILDAAAENSSSLTTALQFALESLGYVSFMNGPDNDFGPTTQGAVIRMKEAKGEAPVPLLTNSEARETICNAAVERGDPVSLYHVALMYQNGWGFPENEAKAAAAISEAETSMINALGGADLPDWKRAAYETYASKIRVASKELKKPKIMPDAAICK